MDWHLTECDVNKDIHVSDMLHISAIKIQVKHLDHLFSVYIKSMAKDTVCRVEERQHSAGKPVIEAINDIFNPADRFAAQLNEIKDTLRILVANRAINENEEHLPENGLA
jgi:hypothetical protein